MKKIFLFLCFTFLMCGCAEKQDNIINNFSDKIENSKNYQLTAKLEIVRGEDKFIYDVVSTYKKGDYFKVDLTNTQNNHQQIILKDKESVYVLTPSLNKSFKFQSDWPYNNSQIYLLQPIIKDVKNDKNCKIEKNNDGYVVNSLVNYSNEKSLKKQKLYFDNNENLTKVEVLDKNESVRMKLQIINIDYDIKLNENFFLIEQYQKNESNDIKNDLEEKKEVTMNEIENIVYPMYIPTETHLSSQDIINTENGERIISTFSGESNFTLIQENLSSRDEMNFIYGEPYIILDTIGAMTDTSVSWISNNIEYSVVSDTMSLDELLTVAQSIGVEPVGK